MITRYAQNEIKNNKIPNLLKYLNVMFDDDGYKSYIYILIQDLIEGQLNKAKFDYLVNCFVKKYYQEGYGESTCHSPNDTYNCSVQTLL